MKKKVVVLLAVVLALALLSSPFIIRAATAAEGGTDLPFKATLAGAARWEFPGSTASNCTVATTITESTGQATHMGQIKALMTHCPADPDIVNDGMMTFIAANGDKLYGVYNYDPMSESDNFPITLNGGTGLFADASGTVIITYQVVPQLIEGCNPDPDPFPCMDFSKSWPWSATINGTISY